MKSAAVSERHGPVAAGGQAGQLAQPQPRHRPLHAQVEQAFRGQHAFDKRLIPNFEQTVGGLYTVLGLAGLVDLMVLSNNPLLPYPLALLTVLGFYAALKVTVPSLMVGWP